MLEVDDLHVGYGRNEVVHGASFSVAEGEAVAIIGSNGAGKTTTLRAIAGLLPAMRGDIRYQGDTLLGTPAHRIAQAGIAFVPAERHLFPRMSVLENLALGAYPAKPQPAQLDLVFTLFPTMAERRSQRAGTMSGGEQQMLAVGRALMARPKLLLLDEPTTGLAPRLAEDAYTSLATLRQEGMTILVAEQQVPLALEFADRGYVLEDGRIRLEGTAEELRHNDEVRHAYLGIA